jgi:hypothetical protein
MQFKRKRTGTNGVRKGVSQQRPPDQLVSGLGTKQFVGSGKHS